MTFPLLIALALGASEDEVFDAWSDGSFLTAGRLAQELLAEQPDSMTGNFVYGYVLWKEEGEHARAQVYLDRAYARYEQQEQAGLLSEESWRMQLRIMDAQLDVLSEMGRPEEELALMEVYNEEFDPGVNVERAWPTMRTRRFDDARAIALNHVDDEDWRQGAALNSMCAIEAEAQQREPSFTWCMRALEHERTLLNPDPTVDASNAAAAALGILEFDLSLELAREATRGSASAVTNPYRKLVMHHVRAANGAAAVDAFENVVAWRAKQRPSMRDLARSASEETLAVFLYAAGRASRARTFIDRAIQFPDRAGLTSAEPMQARGRQAALRLLIRQLQAEQAAEEAALGSWLTRLFHRISTWFPDPGAWEDRATLRSSLMDPRRQEGTFRPYLDGGLELEPFLLGLLAPDVGQGIYATSVEQAARTDALVSSAGRASLAALPAYYDALRSTAAFSAGRERDALRHAERAWEHLPEPEALLRAQVAAVAGASAWDQGRYSEANAWFGRAMALDPGSLRRLGIALPARVTGPDGGISGAIVTLLGRTPRLRIVDGAFEVRVVNRSGRPNICVLDPFGAELSCSHARSLSPEEDTPAPSNWEQAQHHVRQWTQAAFALPTGRAAVDLDSLDGTTLRRRDEERTLLEELIEDL